MSSLRRHTLAHARSVSTVLAVAAIAATGLVSGLVAQIASAWDSGSVSGTFSFSGSFLRGCPTGAILCSSGTFSGDVSGPFQLTLLSTVPSPTPNVLYFNGKLVIHTASGDVDCDLNGAEDTSSTTEGPFGEICTITGGTGGYAHATGDLRLIGTSSSSLLIPAGSGTYQGSIHTS